MADDGFTPQVEWILRKVTGAHQTMLFSATLDGDVGHLVRRYMTDPIEVAIDSATDTVGTMHHLFLAVHHMDKDKVVGAIGQGMAKTSCSARPSACATASSRILQDLGVSVAAIHGDLPQKSRGRRRCGGSPRASCTCWSPPTSPHAASTSTTSAPSSTTSPRPTARTTCTAAAARRAPGRDGWAVTLAEYNQHTQVRILQRALRLPTGPPVEVFSNNPKLRDLPTFARRRDTACTDARGRECAQPDGVSGARRGGSVSKSVDLVDVGQGDADVVEAFEEAVLRLRVHRERVR